MSKICPVCKEKGNRQVAVPPYGPKDSPILIAGEFPGKDELEWGRPFAGGTGKVLTEELALQGIDIRSCRLSNIWIHPPNGDEDCYNLGLSILLREAQNRKGILFLGSDTAKTFTKYKVSEIAGLRMEDDCLLVSANVIVFSQNPAVVFKKGGVVGEIRFALGQFVKAMEQYT